MSRKWTTALCVTVVFLWAAYSKPAVCPVIGSLHRFVDVAEPENMFSIESVQILHKAIKTENDLITSSDVEKISRLEQNISASGIGKVNFRSDCLVGNHQKTVKSDIRSLRILRESGGFWKTVSQAHNQAGVFDSRWRSSQILESNLEFERLCFVKLEMSQYRWSSPAINYKPSTFYISEILDLVKDSRKQPNRESSYDGSGNRVEFVNPIVRGLLSAGCLGFLFLSCWWAVVFALVTDRWYRWFGFSALMCLGILSLFGFSVIALS